eukprot:750459-Pleurochrysis_carterae.AAC.2
MSSDVGCLEGARDVEMYESSGVGRSVELAVVGEPNGVRLGTGLARGSGRTLLISGHHLNVRLCARRVDGYRPSRCSRVSADDVPLEESPPPDEGESGSLAIVVGGNSSARTLANLQSVFVVAQS